MRPSTCWTGGYPDDGSYGERGRVSALSAAKQRLRLLGEHGTGRHARPQRPEHAQC